MMAGKSGRLTFSGRQEYQSVVYVHDGNIVGWAAICTCPLGNHYLAEDASGRIVERTVSKNVPIHLFMSDLGADTAIRTWRLQHVEAQAHSGESEAE